MVVATIYRIVVVRLHIFRYEFVTNQSELYFRYADQIYFGVTDRTFWRLLYFGSEDSVFIFCALVQNPIS